MYAMLGLRTLPIAREKGVLDEEKAGMIREMFMDALGVIRRTDAPCEKGGDGS
jgi:hypothetical protein